KYFDYPLGHPIIITNSFKDIKEYFGFIKCKIVPPPEKYVPILPVRRDNKLIFPLCNACSVDKKYSCNHSPEERALVGTWTTVELQNAINHGY
ncbi:DNA polymerase, partial [Vibrio parahaemolyticus]